MVALDASLPTCAPLAEVTCQMVSMILLEFGPASLAAGTSTSARTAAAVAATARAARVIDHLGDQSACADAIPSAPGAPRALREFSTGPAELRAPAVREGADARVEQLFDAYGFEPRAGA